MPRQNRTKTKYPGVHFIVGVSRTGKPEKIYLIRYRENGKLIEEKAGRQFQDNMTPSRAALIRGERINGEQPPNATRRERLRADREAEESRWTFYRLWIEYKAQKPDLKGLVTDENRFENYIKPYFGEKEPEELNPLDVDRLRLKLLKTRKPGTVKNVLELLRRISNFGVKKNLCNGVPFKIEMPRVNNLKTEDLTADQLASLMKAIEEDTNIQAANFMKMALFTGARRSEIFKLKWEHIDFDRGFIHLVDPKGGPDQMIPLNDAARRLLETHIKTGSPYVFPGRGGGQRVDIKKQVNRIRDRAGLPKDFRALHGLRHVYASMLASSGQVDLYTLQKLLTHKSPVMTQRYAHLRDETLKRAADLAGDIVTEAMNGDPEKVVSIDQSKEG